MVFIVLAFLPCEEQLGFGTAKAVIASEGCDGTRIHAVGSIARAFN
jgi:hypothetical protein